MRSLFVAAFLISTSAFAQWNSSFNTRINDKLAISGRVCKGGERVFSFEVEYCQKGQWIVNVDDVNTCSPDGTCTEIATPSFIAELERANIFIPHDGDYYDIIPVTKVSRNVQSILKKYWLHEMVRGKSKIVEKKL